ncbi:hypothetical protein ACLOJK_019820 [Asimina triloba]
MDFALSSIHLTFSSYSSSQSFGRIRTHLFKTSAQAFLPLPVPKYHPLKSNSVQFPFLRPSSQSHSLSIQKPLASIATPQAQSPELKQSHALKSLVEKLAVLLLGSFLFLGRFTAKPAFALPSTSRAGSAAGLEEKAETHVGEDDEDEKLCLKLLEKNPRDVKALKVVLYGKMKKGKTKEAVEYVERLIEVEPYELEWRLLQALSYELMGQISTAKRLFREILVERPLHIRALHGDDQVPIGEPSGELGMSSGPGGAPSGFYPLRFGGLALAMHKGHEEAAAFEMLNEALELARAQKRVTEERNIKILIAQMHIVKGDLEEGLKRFQALVEEDPRDFRPYLCQGIIYSLLDKRKEADEQFEIYRRLVPNEFPQRGFLDDVMVAAKADSQVKMEKRYRAEF